jgi:hypothetical protein
VKLLDKQQIDSITNTVTTRISIRNQANAALMLKLPNEDYQISEDYRSLLIDCCLKRGVARAVFVYCNAIWIEKFIKEETDARTKHLHNRFVANASHPANYSAACHSPFLQRSETGHLGMF